MRIELWIFGIAALLIINAYYDGKYSKIILSYKKYYKIIFIAGAAIFIYIMLKKNPAQSKNLLYYTNNMIKYMPIDKSSISMLTPIFDLTNKSLNGTSFMEGMNQLQPQNTPNFNYKMTGGVESSSNSNFLHKSVKRSVSETKKKYVASIQDWKCGNCNKKLTHTFEIDHKIRLEYGGSNDPTNLVALCRECHGQKTAMENM
jgi:hypothetical protein